MKEKYYLFGLISVILFSINLRKSDNKSDDLDGNKRKYNNITNNNTYLLVKAPNSKKVEFFLVDTLFNIKDSIACYNAKYEILGNENVFKISSSNHICYFFDSEVDAFHEHYIHHYLIQFNFKTGNSSILYDFKDFQINGWELDNYTNSIVFLDSKLNKLFIFNITSKQFNFIYKFTSTPNHLRINIEKDRYKLFSKENKRTILRSFSKSENKDVFIDTIWTTPSPLVNAYFATDSNLFAEVAPEKIEGNLATLFLYDKKTTLKENLNCLYNYKPIYWMTNRIVINNFDNISVFSKKLELEKKILTGTLKILFSVDNECIIYQQFKPNKAIFMLNKHFNLIELKSQIFEKMQALQAVSNLP